MPIANKHIDSGCHCLIAGVSLGLASSLPRSQTLEFEHGGCCISIVSDGPSPSQCRLLISAPNMAVSGRPLGAIWAVYLFAPNKKPRPGRMVGAPEAFIEINCACGGAKHGGPSEMASSQQCAIPARASTRTISIAFSTLSTPRNPAESGWGCRSAGRSSMSMGVGCGQQQMNLTAPYFSSPCPTRKGSS